MIDTPNGMVLQRKDGHGKWAYLLVRGVLRNMSTNSVIGFVHASRVRLEDVCLFLGSLLESGGGSLKVSINRPAAFVGGISARSYAFTEE